MPTWILRNKLLYVKPFKVCFTVVYSNIKMQNLVFINLKCVSDNDKASPGCKSVVSAIAAICHLICNAHSAKSSLRSVALEMVLQVTQSPKKPFLEPLTYGRKYKVICILVPRSYINLIYSSYCTYDTLASRQRMMIYIIYEALSIYLGNLFPFWDFQNVGQFHILEIIFKANSSLKTSKFHPGLL